MPAKKVPLTETPRGGGRRLLAVAFTLVVIAGTVWGLVRLGDEARRGIGPRDRYRVRFADIQCEPPAGFDRATFLAEVRYTSSFPESFQSLDPDLTAKLTAAFATHPWVAAVEGVAVDTDGGVRVALRYRVPSLRVHFHDGTVRAVDVEAVLLPRNAETNGLPELVNPVAGGTDPVVRRAVELLAAHRPQKLENTVGGWRLTMPDGKVLLVGK